MRYRMVVMGALAMQLVKSHFVSVYDPTFKDNYRTQMVVDGEACQQHVLDTTRSEENQARLLRRQKFMRRGEGFLCVYAVDDPKAFADVNIFRDQLRTVKGTNQGPFVLAANKTDLSDGLVFPALGQEAAKSFKVPLVEASAKTQKGVEHAFEMLVLQVRRSHVEAGKRLPDASPVRGLWVQTLHDPVPLPTLFLPPKSTSGTPQSPLPLPSLPLEHPNL